MIEFRPDYGNQLHFHFNSPSAPEGGYNPVLFKITPVLNQWYHLAITRQAGTYTMFTNGNVVAKGINNVSIPNPSAPLTIGWAEEGYFFHGGIDEIHIFKRALEPNEVQAIYKAGSTGICKSGVTDTRGPSFGQIARLQDGAIHVRLFGETGRNFVIEVSEDLIHWVPTHSDIAVSGSIDFVDPAAKNLQRRFYRAVSP